MFFLYINIYIHIGQLIIYKDDERKTKQDISFKLKNESKKLEI